MRYFNFKICLFLLASVISTVGHAQDVDRPVLQDALPPAPNAASLGKFADWPVSLYTGTPQINIPLHQIKSGDLSLDISLSYHASGVKVEEIPSWVGSGWALNAGGVVTRATRGLPDDENQGLFNTSPILTSYDGENDMHRETFRLYAEGYRDSQPDLFYFNFAGYTGKAFIKKDGTTFKAHVVPYQKLKVVPFFSDTDGKITSWEFTTENGTKYIFDQTEKTGTFSHWNGQYVSNPLLPIISSWFLSSIESVTGSKIEFIYQDYGLPAQQMSHSETKYFFVESDGEANYQPMNSTFYNFMELRDGKRLQKIVYDNGEVEFVPGNDRCDLIGDNMLREVQVKDKSSTPKVLKKWVFEHVYMEGRLIKSVDAPCTTEPDYNKRLTLAALYETDGAEVNAKSPYRFSYILNNSEGFGLPPRARKDWTGPTSFFAQDHWGYFNGEIGNKTLVPEMFYNHPDGRVIYVEGAKKRPEESSAKVGSLYKVTYPTGGFSSFEYELHDCATGQVAPDIKSKTVIIGFPMGGMSGGPVESETFTVNSDEIGPGQTEKGAYTTITNLSIAIDEAGAHLNNLFLQGSTGTASYFSTSGMTSLDIDRQHVVYLPNGEYFVKYEGVTPSTPTEENNNTDYTARMNLQIDEMKKNPNRKVGGLRVRRITDYDPVSEKTNTKSYHYKDLSGISTGSMVNGIAYGHNYAELIMAPGRMGLLYSNYYWVRNSTPNIPLVSTQGSPIGYNKVSVFLGESSTTEDIGSIGKTEYTYYSPKERPDVKAGITATFPYAPADSKDWQRGLLRALTIFKKEGSSFVPVKRTFNEYSFYDKDTDPNYDDVLGVKVGFTWRSHPESLFFDFRHEYFVTRTGYYKPLYTTETLYNAAGNPTLTTRTDYEFSTDHLQLTKSTQLINDGEGAAKKRIVENTYPADYTSVSSGPLYEMRRDEGNGLHIHNAIVEQLVKVEENGVQKIVGGQVIEYGNFASAHTRGTTVLPLKMYNLETDKPLSTTQLSSSKPNFNINTTYFKPKTKYGYDLKGNLRQQHQLSEDTPTEVINPSSLIWGLNNTVPIAVASNSVSDKIAYTGFEQGENADWVLAGSTYVETGERKTGLASRKFSTGSSVLKNMPATATKYLVSFWAKAVSASGNVSLNGTSIPISSSWTFHQKEVTLTSGGNIKITNSGAQIYLDEVRIHPKEATMRTFSYSPLGNVITMTDENGVPTYYDYDPLHRLETVKDKDKNIVNTYEYNYQIP